MKQPFFLKTWFIGILYAFWFIYGIPLAIGIILTIIQTRRQNRFLEAHENVEQAESRLQQLNSSYEDKLNELRVMEEKTRDKLKTEEAEVKERLRVEESQFIDKFRAEKSKLEKEMFDLEMESEVRQYDFSDYSGLSSEECKNKLSLLKLNEKEMIRSDEVFSVNSELEKKKLNDNRKQILRCFNAECDNILQNVSVKRIDAMRKKMTASFESLNKIFSIDGVTLNYCILECKLEELNLVYTYELKKEQEKEERKAIREQMLEEEKVRKEIEREKAKLEKDQTQCNKEVHRLMNYLQKTANDAEKQLYIDKIQELEGKIKELQEKKENVLEREANARAGFVYIISNIGSFGEDVYKIGMTRRLEPMDRIKELSSASVPFGFDVHAMIFSDDAPALESVLHKHFEKQSVNRVNSRKEFFHVSLGEIEKVVKENFNNTVIFTEFPPAFEYRQTLEILEDEKRNAV